MKTKILLILGAVVALIAMFYYFQASPVKRALQYETILGEPGNHSPDRRLANLPMDIEFDQANARIISRQDNGAIIAWDVRSGKSATLAQTSGLFAYCRKKRLVLIHADNAVFLIDLNNSERRRVFDGLYHHAVWKNDCASFAIAKQKSNEIMLWDTADLSRHDVVLAVGPVRNGLAMSDDGQFIAAAQGTYEDGVGHNTNLEIFKITAGPKFKRLATDNRASAILGMWRMVFTPEGQSLIVGSQTNGQSGLRSFSTRKGTINWYHDGFASYWVRALAASPDGRLLATGDEKGFLRLWKLSNGKKLYEAQTDLVIQTVSFADDGKKLAIALWDSTIAIADVGKLLE